MVLLQKQRSAGLNVHEWRSGVEELLGEDEIKSFPEVGRILRILLGDIDTWASMGLARLLLARGRR